MNSIYLVRHPALMAQFSGTPFIGRTDCLAEADSASRLQQALLALKVDRLVSSPLARCANLAQDLAAQMQRPLLLDSNWQERDWGAWDGCALADINPQALQAYYDEPFDYAIAQAETFVAMQSRIQQAWLDLVALKQDVLCICHGGPMRLVLQQQLGLANEALFQLRIDYGTLIGFEVHHTEQGVFSQLCLMQPLLERRLDSKG
ncbi:histidine phosphatase family protein [Thiomicrospira sp. ALE5]|uniref:histidine phosphatase family protein n=1 Tax=Thiomicrospira sp. ALE5 TaxID=748650 RepID=UPI0008E0A9E1|nr:histidine phosphatase family protein [Thiomicrospira sp. ALE5]SFR58854.1 alpha-ribazole phosphatase [Thiomicrospira sp. ALE5]